MLVRRGGRPSRNRPGMEQQAIRRTQDSMNITNKIMAVDSGAEKEVLRAKGDVLDAENGVIFFGIAPFRLRQYWRSHIIARKRLP